MTAEAVSQFDAAAQAIFTATITACKLTRPNASVGYYGYPGMISPADPKPKSFAGPELLWLWRQLGVLTPSDYLWTAFDGKQTERARVNVEMSLHLASRTAALLWFAEFAQPKQHLAGHLAPHCHSGRSGSRQPLAQLERL